MPRKGLTLERGITEEIVDKPKLSFIVPYFGKIKSINKCLKSLFSQSVKNFEVIVVMDGSDSEAKQIFQRNKKIRLFEILHGGAPKARNFGLSKAESDVVVFWDADCYIEHGAADVWLQILDKYPDVDFVYSGYRFQEGMGAIPGEEFDPWLLQINNYISGCFPIRKSKCPKWDESLKSLQDWDFWLTAVENGCKGKFIRGHAFQTDYPDAKSISGSGCTPENWLDRLETVKRKHNIPLRSVCVSAIPCREDGVRLAKVLDADYRDYPTYFPNRYDTIIQVGFDPHMADTHAKNFVNRNDPQARLRNILFWRAQDSHSMMYEVARAANDALVTVLNGAVKFQFCEDENTKKILRKLGFNVVVLPLPINTDKQVINHLPEKFKVLLDVHPSYKIVFDSIQRACPDVSFTVWTGSVNVDDFSVLLRFQPDRCLDQSVKKVLLNGRRVISNIQSPYCGFIPFEEGMGAAREEIIHAIRDAQKETKTNDEAAQYYIDVCSPKKFVDVMHTVGALGVHEVALV